MLRSAADVSIITVNWNGRAHLETLLPTLLPLGAKEILVVDNGSTDGSTEWLAHCFPRVRILRNETNRGFAQPNNWAAKEAKGSVLALINNDMRADGAWLTEGLQGLRQRACTACKILDWKGERVDFNGSSLQYLGYAQNRDIGKLLDQVSSEDTLLFPCGGAMLIDREVFLESGGFDEEFFAIFEDVDLGWRLWLTGYEVGYAPKSVVFHKGHATFNTHHEAKLRYLMHRNALLMVLKNYEDEFYRTIFPLALVMAVRRAVRLTRVPRESLYLWAEVRSRLEEMDRSAYSDLLDAFNHLVSVDDVLRLLPSMLQKRAAIQAKRKRPDREILRLFGDPLRPIVADYEYAETELAYLRKTGLDELFDLEGYERMAAPFTHPLAMRIEALRQEVGALQWLSMTEVSHPCERRPARSRLTRFYRKARAYGIRYAVRSALGSVRRGP